MEERREGDLRVPLISSLFCIFVLTGGVFLTIYVFVPNASQPWFPAVALILIGSPWIFWLLTYMYTCAKACCRRNTTTNQDQMSRRYGSTNNNRSVQAAPQNPAKDGGSPVTSPNGGEKHVHFGQVVVMEGDESSRGGTEVSISSAKEIEMPLNTGPSS